MFFLFEERHALVRTSTHTVVLDRDRDFEDFGREAPGATRARLVRVWTAEFEGRRALPRAYLGSVLFCPSSPVPAQAARLLRRLSRSAPAAEGPLRAWRRRLVRQLRDFSGR